MSIEDKFNAAVNVIRGLPKNGPYQPSYDLMLRFYAYFKQGTEGTCKGRRPAFWDVVGKAKYDAWKRLGEMPSEKAMELYVDELRKIVETMSFTQNVADFYSSLSDLENVSVSDLELVAPDVIRNKSESNSPVHEHRESIVHNNNSNNTNDIPNGHADSTPESSDDDDEYIDTVEDEIQVEHTLPRKNIYSHHNGGIHKKVLPMTEVTNKLNIDSSLMSHLVQSITDNMKVDLQQVNSRLTALEQKITKKQPQQQRKYPSWWPLQDISPSFFVFTLIWPVAVAIAFRTMQQSKLNHGVGKRS